MAQPQGSIRLLGGGGHAKVVLATLLDAGYTCSGIHDDDPALWGRTLLGRPILGPLATVSSDEPCLAAFGDNALRQRIVQRFPAARWATVVHPSAYVHPSVNLGPGTVVFAGGVVQPEAVLGDHVILNTAASVDHDCLVGNFVHFAPGARLAGTVSIAEGAFLGIGSSVGPNLSVGAWSQVGAGATVLASIPARRLAVGTPARVLKELP